MDSVQRQALSTTGSIASTSGGTTGGGNVTSVTQPNTSTASTSTSAGTHVPIAMDQKISTASNSDGASDAAGGTNAANNSPVKNFVEDNDSLRSVPDDIDRNSSTASTSPRASGASNAATTSPVGNDDDSSTASNSGGDAGASGGSYAGNNSTVANDEDNDREVATLTHDVANMGPNALDENGNWQSKARCDKCLIDFDNAAAFQTHFAEHHHGLQITLPLDEAVSGPARLHLSNQDVSSANLLLSLHSSRNSSRASSPPSTASPTETQPPESLTPQPTHNAPSTPPAPTPNPTLSALSTSAAPTPPVPTPPRPHISRSCPSLSDFTNSVNAAGVLICLSLLM